MGKRIATSLVLIPLAILFVWFLPPLWFAVLVGMVALLGAWEWAGLLGFANGWRATYCLIVSLGFVLLGYAPLDNGPWVLLLAVVWWLIVAVTLRTASLGSSWWIAGGVLSLLFGWYALLWLRYQTFGPVLVLLLFFLIWIADSAAYFGGRQFGRHKLAPRLSPGKTVEGLIFALVAAVLFSIMVAMLQLPAVDMTQVLWVSALAILVVVFSVIGDLFESQLKRSVGVKDSGNWLPGHGGVLDRIDSMVAAAPVFALGVLVVLRDPAA